MKHLKWLGTGFLFVAVEVGTIILVFKTHYGPYIFLFLLGVGGSYLMGMALHKGE